ncbi:MAG: AEC family transporter, partial [Alphaproteobacteria bacterium]|nr:AEC family transporter [Alphaproteobacteria bacterium]
MQNVISVVAPVFALIAIGYAAGRARWMSESGARGLAEFTFNIAIPAMLFRKMATAELPDVTPYALWGAYFLSAAVIWLLTTVATLFVLRRSAEEASAISMSASFGNVVMIGMPLCLNLYGEAAAAPVAIIVSLHSPALWAVASFHLALARSDAQVSPTSIARELIVELSRNAIIVAIIAGTLWRLSGLSFAPLADDIITLVGQAG